MVEYILGNHLVEAGKITKAQLKQVMDEHNSVRVKLGLIAVSEGMMTMEQADSVNRLQALRDQRFGDIAIEKGYLTDEQVEKLLKKQGNAYLMFVQTLIDDGYITIEELDWLLNDFRHEHGLSLSDLEDLKSDDVERIVPLLLPEEAMQYKDLICLAMRTMIRFIDRNIYMGRAVMVESLPTNAYATQSLAWERGLVDFLSERDGALLQLSCRFGRMDFEQLDLEALDAAGEFLNCINGLYVAKLSREGGFMDLMPPLYNECKDRIKNNYLCRIPVFIGEHGLYFTVAEMA